MLHSFSNICLCKGCTMITTKHKICNRRKIIWPKDTCYYSEKKMCSMIDMSAVLSYYASSNRSISLCMKVPSHPGYGFPERVESRWLDALGNAWKCFTSHPKGLFSSDWLTEKESLVLASVELLSRSLIPLFLWCWKDSTEGDQWW